MEQGAKKPSELAPPPPRIRGPITPNPDLIGHLIGDKYVLLRLIGRGGMGAVYEARHEQTGKRCAVKLLVSPELSLNEGLVRRFYREARASSQIESEHIVQVFDSGSDAYTGFPYMVMEFLAGEDLEHTVRRVGPIEPSAAAAIALQAATGLARAHEAGIIHRDIKPGNLFLTTRDTGGMVVKILDFGIAKVKMEGYGKNNSNALGALTKTGSMLGTPLYMSPEQARGASKVDARSDVWSLGVVMYNLLSARLPFEDMTALGELLIAIVTSDIPPLQDRAPWVPPELAEIVHTAMSRDLAQRYQDGSQMRDALARIVPGTPTVTSEMLTPLSPDLRSSVASKVSMGVEHLRVSSTNTGTAVTAASEERRRRSNLLVPLVAAGAIALTAGGFLLWRRMHKDAPVPVGLTHDQTAVPVPSSSASSVESKTFPLEVGPEGVEVTVDGTRAQVQSGKIDLSGAPGTTRVVKLSLKNVTAEQTVAITLAGLLPARVDLPTAASSSRPPAGKGATANTKPPADQPPAKSDVPPAKKGPDKVERDLSEFK
ncbi:MAG: serine/threonine protein kinase [Deltaproteobacteria bacterium]|nr:serine/threonine protein kinase [Deltaproteobacteria bacterium]